METGRDDESDAEAGETRDDGERDVLLLDEFLPQIVGGEFVDENEAEAKDGDAGDGKDGGRQEAVEKGLSVHGSLVLRAEKGGIGTRREGAAD